MQGSADESLQLFWPARKKLLGMPLFSRERGRIKRIHLLLRCIKGTYPDVGLCFAWRVYAYHDIRFTDFIIPS